MTYQPPELLTVASENPMANIFAEDYEKGETKYLMLRKDINAQVLGKISGVFDIHKFRLNGETRYGVCCHHENYFKAKQETEQPQVVVIPDQPAEDDSEFQEARILSIDEIKMRNVRLD